MEKFADELDRATSYAAEEVKLKISEIRAVKPVVVATGLCLFCDSAVEGNRRWCDADCRDLWEAEKRGGR